MHERWACCMKFNMLCEKTIASLKCGTYTICTEMFGISHTHARNGKWSVDKYVNWWQNGGSAKAKHWTQWCGSLFGAPLCGASIYWAFSKYLEMRFSHLWHIKESKHKSNLSKQKCIEWNANANSVCERSSSCISRCLQKSNTWWTCSTLFRDNGVHIRLTLCLAKLRTKDNVWLCLRLHQCESVRNVIWCNVMYDIVYIILFSNRSLKTLNYSRNAGYWILVGFVC